MTYPIIIHGSENSLDRDAYIIIKEPLSNQEAKKLCLSYPEINANLLVIQDGKVAWSYKGTKDECNNSILATYSLHSQDFPCPITERADRAYALKFARTIRGLLSYVSRTEHRIEVKKALASESIEYKLEVLKKIDLLEIKDFEKSSTIETYKFFAFQMGQTLALLKDNTELFTKNSVASYYPELKPYLDRKVTSAEKLQVFYMNFIDFSLNTYKKIENHALYAFNFHGTKEVVDFKKETVLPRVAIFDLDGTLFNESHRAHLRENKEWEKYFLACNLDTPIKHIVALTHEYRAKGYEIWIMSGRGEVALQMTIESLKEHDVQYDKIKLRSKDVFIPDYVLKPAWVSKYIGMERVDVVYDDTDKVIQGFRNKGLNTIDVKELIPAITSKKGI